MDDANIKILSDNTNEYLVLFSRDKRICKVLPDLASNLTLQPQNLNLPLKENLGNPIFDIILFAHKKFGPFHCSFGDYFKGISVCLTNEVSDKKTKFVQLTTYKKKLPNVCTFITTITEDKVMHEVNELTPVPDISSVLISRVPLHICTIESSRMVPLIDGRKQSLDSFSRLKEISDKVKLIKFGFFEKFMSLIEADKFFVFSIVGSQSSGKSYLLNNMFGTRFFVNSTRCTDGIWVSYAFIDSKHCLLFDCQGLFSVNRSKIEEIKLITFLAAIGSRDGQI